MDPFATVLFRIAIMLNLALLVWLVLSIGSRLKRISDQLNTLIHGSPPRHPMCRCEPEDEEDEEDAEDFPPEDDEP